MNSDDEKLVPDSYEDIICSAWFELKELYEQHFHAGPEFEAFVIEQTELFESGADCDFRRSLKDRMAFGIADRINPRGTFFIALAAAYSSQAQGLLGNAEASWAYAASSMYWIGHTRVAVQVDALRREARSAQASNAAQSKNREQWDFVEERVQELIAGRPADAPPMSASKAASQIYEKLKAAFGEGPQVIAFNTLYQDFAKRGCFTVKRRA